MSRKTENLGVTYSRGILRMILVYLLIWPCYLCVCFHWNMGSLGTGGSYSTQVNNKCLWNWTWKWMNLENQFLDSVGSVALLFLVHSSNCQWNVWEDSFPHLFLDNVFKVLWVGMLSMLHLSLLSSFCTSSVILQDVKQCLTRGKFKTWIYSLITFQGPI